MFKKILFPVDMDNQEFAEKALNVAIGQAQENGASIHVVTVIPGFGMQMVGSFFPEDAMQKAMAAVDQKLKDYVKKKIPAGIHASSKALQGKAHKEILRESKEVGADLIVIPSHNYKKVDRALLGSCTSRVVERSKVSVMVIKP